MRFSTLFCTVATALVSASTAQAVLIGYEGFAGYTVGAPLDGQAGTGNIGFEAGSTWTGILHNARAESLSYTNGGTLLTTGGSLISNHTDGSTNIRPLAAPIATTSTTGEEFWLSYLFKGGPVTQDANLVRFYVEAGAGGQDGQRIDLNVIRGWPDTSELYTRSESYFGGGAPYQADSTVKIADQDDVPPTHENTFFLVLQYVLDDANTAGGQAVMRVYVNPVIGGAAPDISTAVSVQSGFGGFDSPDMLRLWTPGKGSDAVIRDEIRWGTTWADVAPVAAAPLPGDYNGDGSVNQLDHAKWVEQFGQSLPEADGNQNGVVDAGDYNIWRDNVPVPASVASVPEPAAMIVLVLGGSLIGWRRCRE